MYPPASAATEGGSQGPQFPAPLSHPSRLHRGPQAESQVCHLAFGPVQGAVKGWGGGAGGHQQHLLRTLAAPGLPFIQKAPCTSWTLAPAKSPLHLPKAPCTSWTDSGVTLQNCCASYITCCSKWSLCVWSGRSPATPVPNKWPFEMSVTSQIDTIMIIL